MHKQQREFSPPLLPLETLFLKWISHMTALPLRAPFAELEARMRAQLEARMRAQSEAFDKSTAPRAKGPEFINFNKPGNYVIRFPPRRCQPIPFVINRL
jgi:hypothetical protein